MVLKVITLLKNVSDTGKGKGMTKSAMFDNGCYGVQLDGKLYWVPAADVTVVEEK